MSLKSLRMYRSPDSDQRGSWSNLKLRTTGKEGRDGKSARREGGKRREGKRRREREVDYSLRSFVDEPKLAEQSDKSTVLQLPRHLALQDIGVAANRNENRKVSVRSRVSNRRVLTRFKSRNYNPLHASIQLIQYPRSKHTQHLIDPLRSRFAEQEQHEVLDLEGVGTREDFESFGKVLDG